MAVVIPPDVKMILVKKHDERTPADLSRLATFAQANAPLPLREREGPKPQAWEGVETDRHPPCLAASLNTPLALSLRSS